METKKINVVSETYRNRNIFKNMILHGKYCNRKIIQKYLNNTR